MKKRIYKNDLNEGIRKRENFDKPLFRFIRNIIVLNSCTRIEIFDRSANRIVVNITSNFWEYEAFFSPFFFYTSLLFRSRRKDFVTCRCAVA